MSYELFFLDGEKKWFNGWFWGDFGGIKSEWREKMDVISLRNLGNEKK
jgi:hypothetical protein